MTIDDVVTKTGITLGVLAVSALISYVLVNSNVGLAAPFVIGGGLIGLVLVLVATFGRKMDNPAIVLAYAVAEGFFLGALSFMFTDITFGGAGGATLIAQAVLGTFGVFFGMLVVYRTGAIRVTPRLTRMIVGASSVSWSWRWAISSPASSSTVAWACATAARSPSSSARVHRHRGVQLPAGLRLRRSADPRTAPEKAAWGVALGLTVTLVWLYVEILRLLSYFQND